MDHVVMETDPTLHHLERDDGSMQPFYRVLFPDGSGLDIFEAFWSPLTKHKVSTLKALSWLTECALNPDAFSAVGSPCRKRILDYVVLGFAFGAALILVFLVLASIAVMASVTIIAAMAFFSRKDVFQIELKPLALIFLVPAAWYVPIALNGALFKGIWSTTSRMVTVCLLVWLFRQVNISTISIDSATGTLLWLIPCIAFGLIGQFLPLVQWMVREFIADPFTASRTDVNDEEHEFRVARTAVVISLLKQITYGPFAFGNTNCQYKSVALIGHSLGSVIAYDAIRTCTEEHFVAEEANERERFLPRLRILLTCGSPLAKIAGLRGWRKRSSTLHEKYFRRETTSAFANCQPKQDRNHGVLWTNLYSYADSISDPLRNDPMVGGADVTDINAGNGFCSHTGYYRSLAFWRGNGEKKGLLGLLDLRVDPKAAPANEPITRFSWFLSRALMLWRALSPMRFRVLSFVLLVVSLVATAFFVQMWPLIILTLLLFGWCVDFEVDRASRGKALA